MTNVMASGTRVRIAWSIMKPLVAFLLLTFISLPLFAHCDSVKGPVVVAAQQALAKGDVTPVLKWVRAEDEKEIRDAFAKTMEVRTQSAAAKAMADRWFFETLVRVHRAGEGAPYTGLQDADVKVDEGIELADASIESGSLEAAEKALVAAVSSGLRQRFAEVVKAREHAGHNVEAGRHYVHAYVEFIHYAERLHQAATTSAAHGEGAAHEEH
jgi:hypothetical protein